MFQHNCGVEPEDTREAVSSLTFAMLSLTTAPCIGKVVKTTLTAEPRAQHPAVWCVRLGQTLTDSLRNLIPPQPRKSSSSDDGRHLE